MYVRTLQGFKDLQENTYRSVGETFVTTPTRFQQIQTYGSRRGVGDILTVIENPVHIYQFSADHEEVGKANYIAAVKNNWSKLPEGQSVVECNVGTRGTAIVYKYPGSHKDTHGYAITFGYDGKSPKMHTFKAGEWSTTWGDTGGEEN